MEENMEEYLKENPDFIDILYDNIKEVHKRDILNNLHELDQHTLILINRLIFIPDSLIDDVKDDNTFIMIENKIKNIIDNINDINKDLQNIYNNIDNDYKDLQNIYNNNYEKIKSYISENIFNLKLSSVNNQKEKDNINNILKNQNINEDDKIIILNKIFSNHIDKKNYEYICSIEEYSKINLLKFIKKDDLLALRCNIEHLKRYAYTIYNPFYIEYIMLQIFKNKDKIQFFWYFEKLLPINIFYDTLINNNTISCFYKKSFFYSINRIKENIKDPLLKDYKDICEEIIFLIKKKKLILLSISLFPLIEKILWDFLLFIDYVLEKKIFIDFKNNKVFDCFKGEEFTSDKIREILERTYIKKYLDINFIKIYCLELYDIRNLVLHGRIDCYKCNKCNNVIINKIFIIDYLLDELLKIKKNTIFNKLKSDEAFLKLYDNLKNN